MGSFLINFLKCKHVLFSADAFKGEIYYSLRDYVENIKYLYGETQ